MTGTLRRCVISLIPRKQLQPVHLRHVDVGKDQSERTGPQEVYSFGAIAGFMDFADRQIGLAQNPLQDFADGGGVVDDQNI